jgi:copper(I)-binding protein
LKELSPRRAVLAWLLIAGLVAACSSGEFGFPDVTNVRIGQPTGPNAALYFTAEGHGEADTLLSVETEAAPAAELHETVMDDGGTMSMQTLPSLELPASGDLVLEPGGYHIMLIDVDRLDVGDTVEVTLVWETSGSQSIQAMVVDPADTMGGEMDHDKDEMGGDG